MMNRLEKLQQYGTLKQQEAETLAQKRKEALNKGLESIADLAPKMKELSATYLACLKNNFSLDSFMNSFSHKYDFHLYQRDLLADEKSPDNLYFKFEFEGLKKGLLVNQNGKCLQFDFGESYDTLMTFPKDLFDNLFEAPPEEFTPSEEVLVQKFCSRFCTLEKELYSHIDKTMGDFFHQISINKVLEQISSAQRAGYRPEHMSVQVDQESNTISLYVSEEDGIRTFAKDILNVEDSGINLEKLAKELDYSSIDYHLSPDNPSLQYIR